MKRATWRYRKGARPPSVPLSARLVKQSAAVGRSAVRRSFERAFSPGWRPRTVCLVPTLLHGSSRIMQATRNESTLVLDVPVHQGAIFAGKYKVDRVLG